MLKLLVVVVVLAVLVYALVRVIDRRGVSSPRSNAPDDDPDFLRGLDQRRWEEKRRRRNGDPTGPADDDPAG